MHSDNDGDGGDDAGGDHAPAKRPRSFNTYFINRHTDCFVLASLRALWSTFEYRSALPLDHLRCQSQHCVARELASVMHSAACRKDTEVGRLRDAVSHWNSAGRCGLAVASSGLGVATEFLHLLCRCLCTCGGLGPKLDAHYAQDVSVPTTCFPCRLLSVSWIVERRCSGCNKQWICSSRKVDTGIMLSMSNMRRHDAGTETHEDPGAIATILQGGMAETLRPWHDRVILDDQTQCACPTGSVSPRADTCRTDVAPPVLAIEVAYDTAADLNSVDVADRNTGWSVLGSGAPLHLPFIGTAPYSASGAILVRGEHYVAITRQGSQWQLWNDSSLSSTSLQDLRADGWVVTMVILYQHRDPEAPPLHVNLVQRVREWEQLHPAGNGSGAGSPRSGPPVDKRRRASAGAMSNCVAGANRGPPSACSGHNGTGAGRAGGPKHTELF